MNLPSAICLTEVGPRDGLQNETTHLTVDEKVALLDQLAAAGLREVEITSFVNPRAVPQLADAEEVVAATRDARLLRWALVGNVRGYERARRCRVEGITVVMSATETHNKRNLNRSRAESLAEFAPILEGALDAGVAARVSISMVFGCPFEGKTDEAEVERIIETLASTGVRRFGLCDTIGVANPRQVHEMAKRLIASFPGFQFELHLHNTYGRALANTVAGLQAGIERFDACIGGLGGCPFAPGATGNVATEDVVALMNELQIETNVDIDRLLDTSDYLCGKLGRSMSSSVWAVHRSREAARERCSP